MKNAAPPTAPWKCSAASTASPVRSSQCFDGAFCEPPPDWVIQGYTLGGAVEVGTEYFIDRTPSIRPSRKMELGMENLADYVQENPDLVVRRPGDLQ